MSIYDQLGGGGSIGLAVDDFYVRVLGDPSLAPFFEGVDLAGLKSHQRAFMAAALGGSEVYSGRDMAAAHAGMNITDADFDAVVGHLVATLTDLGVPADIIGAVGEKLGPLRTDIVTSPSPVG